MNENNLWEQFEMTGSIESYMKYKGVTELDTGNKAVELRNDENGWINY